jgi:hypothetical protein
VYNLDKDQALYIIKFLLSPIFRKRQRVPLVSVAMQGVLQNEKQPQKPRVLMRTLINNKVKEVMILKLLTKQEKKLLRKQLFMKMMEYLMMEYLMILLTTTVKLKKLVLKS